MRIFLGVLTRGRVVVRDLVDRIEDMAGATLPFGARPYRSSVWEAPSGRLAVWAWDDRGQDGDGLVDIRPDSRSAQAWGGLPHMVSSADASRLTADDVDGSLSASTSLTRLAPVYWTRTHDAWWVSGRALLLARLASVDGRPVYDHASLVPFITDGYLRHDRTPFVGVETLGPAGTLSVRDDAIHVEVPDPADLRCGSLTPQPSDLDELIGDLDQAVRSSASGDVVCTLTGGRDSRLVAATLHAAGIPFRAVTRGASDHPDVVVARRVAQALGVPHERESLPTLTEGDADVLEIDLAARTRAVLFGSDGMLFAWQHPSADLPDAVAGSTIFGGGGGETLRGGFAKRVSPDLEPSWDEAAAFLWSRNEDFGRLFRPGVTDAYVRTLAAWIDAERAAGVPAGVSLDRYYLWYRTGRWKAALLASGNAGVPRQPLLDDAITRFGLRLAPAAKAGERIAEGTTERLAPSLRGVAYAGVAHSRAELASGGPPPPFDWRLTTTDQMFDAFRDQVFEARGSQALLTIMDRDRLARWFERRAGKAPSGFARTPMFMWGLYSCGVLLSNDWLEPQRGVPQLVRVRIPAGTPAVGGE